MIINTVQIQPLTIENFQPFGEVICCDGHDFFHINDAHTERYHALVETEIEGEAKAGISICLLYTSDAADEATIV